VPISFLDQNYQSIIIEGVLRDLDLARTTASPEDSAQVYQGLGDRYCVLHMYGRAMAMYRKSLNTCFSEDVRVTLAGLLINLLGEVGIDEARNLIRLQEENRPATTRGCYIMSLPQLLSTANSVKIKEWIEWKQAAVARHQRRETWTNSTLN
jgi:hypothetical protein